MPVDWSSFIGALSARGCSFADVQCATDRKGLIHSLGITDPLDVAIIETMWNNKTTTTTTTTTTTAATPSSSFGAAAGTSSRKNASNPTTTPPPPLANMPSSSSSWHRMDPSRLRHEPEEIQDSVIAEELSFALRGISGAIIRFSSSSSSSGGDDNSENPSAKKPIVAPTLPTSTTQMIHHALQNTTALFSLEQICKHEYAGGSLIRSAVGEAVREVCAAYVRCVADLQEKCAASSFSLSRLCTEVDGVGYAVRRLATLFSDINKQANLASSSSAHPDASAGAAAPPPPLAPDGSGGLTGPWLLNAIHMQYNRATGNADDEKIIGLILRRAARPYLKILFDWMHRGDLRSDPFREFFVIDTTTTTTTATSKPSQKQQKGADAAASNTDTQLRDAIDRWENRFQLVTKQVPNFLAQNKVYKQIHTSGKYCHMLREQQLSSSSTVGGGGNNSNLSEDAAASSSGGSSNNNKNAAVDLTARQQQQLLHPVGGDAAAAAATSTSNAIINNQTSAASATTTTPLLLEEDDDDTLLEWGDNGRLERSVHRAHTYASTHVLKMLVTRHRLVDRLKSLRVYFFVAQGDWLVNFLDASSKLLQRPASEVKNYTLNVLLQSSISKSCSREDPCHSYTRCSLSDATLAQAIELSRQRDPTFTNVYRGYAHGKASSSSLSLEQQQQQQQRRGAAAGSASEKNTTNALANIPSFELLQLEIASDWPLSLILNDIFVTKLNFAFRLLLRCKVCERALHSLVWNQTYYNRQRHQQFGGGAAAAADGASATATGDDSSSSPATMDSISGTNGVAISLRSQLLQFVRQFQFYAAHEVLEPAWKTFLTKVEMAPGINHIGSASSELCHTILRGLALTSEHGFRILWKILDIGLEFSQLMVTWLAAQQQQQHVGVAQSLLQQPQQQQVQNQLAEWQTELYRLLTELADPNKPDSTNLLQMLVWLDFNGFYERLGVYKVRHAASARQQQQHDGAE